MEFKKFRKELEMSSISIYGRTTPLLIYINDIFKETILPPNEKYDDYSIAAIVPSEHFTLKVYLK